MHSQQQKNKGLANSRKSANEQHHSEDYDAEEEDDMDDRIGYNNQYNEDGGGDEETAAVRQKKNLVSGFGKGVVGKRLVSTKSTQPLVKKDEEEATETGGTGNTNAHHDQPTDRINRSSIIELRGSPDEIEDLRRLENTTLAKLL